MVVTLAGSTIFSSAQSDIRDSPKSAVYAQRVSTGARVTARSAETAPQSLQLYPQIVEYAHLIHDKREKRVFDIPIAGRIT